VENWSGRGRPFHEDPGDPRMHGSPLPHQASTLLAGSEDPTFREMKKHHSATERTLWARAQQYDGRYTHRGSVRSFIERLAYGAETCL
jgi:hypothetical protein